jgi:hypothetical protein
MPSEPRGLNLELKSFWRILHLPRTMRRSRCISCQSPQINQQKPPEPGRKSPHLRPFPRLTLSLSRLKTKRNLLSLARQLPVLVLVPAALVLTSYWSVRLPQVRVVDSILLRVVAAAAAARLSASRVTALWCRHPKTSLPSQALLPPITCRHSPSTLTRVLPNVPGSPTPTRMKRKTMMTTIHSDCRHHPSTARPSCIRTSRNTCVETQEVRNVASSHP